MKTVGVTVTQTRHHLSNVNRKKMSESFYSQKTIDPAHSDRKEGFRAIYKIG